MHIYLREYDTQAGFKSRGDEARHMHLFGHELLRLALRPKIGDLSKDEWESALVYAGAGKPYLKEDPKLHFNLSHTVGLAAAVTGAAEVGIDAEKIRPFTPAILRKLTEGERQYIRRHAMSDEAFMRVWTMKEAYVKLTGEGLAGFDKIECIPGEALCNVMYRQFIWKGRYVITAMEGRNNTN